MKRAVVVGSGGSGKSTFAHELGHLTGLPVIHLDREFWRPGWEETPRDEWKTRVEEMLTGERWIMDGNFGGTREMRMRAADTIIFLDLPRWLCLYRIFRRTFKYHGKSRPDMALGCDERWDPKFILWVWNYPNRGRKSVFRELAGFTEKRVIILRNPSQVRDFLRIREVHRMSKLLLMVATVLVSLGSISAQENLLANPDGIDGTRNWKVFGEVTSEVSGFAVRKGHAVQIIKLEEATGKFVLIIARGSTEKFKSDRLLTGFPSLSGYLLSTYQPHGVNQINTYMNAGSPTAPDKIEKVYGIYEVPPNTVAAQVIIGRGQRQGEDDDDSAAMFHSVGLYVFDTQAEAIKFAKSF